MSDFHVACIAIDRLCLVYPAMAMAMAMAIPSVCKQSHQTQKHVARNKCYIVFDLQTFINVYISTITYPFIVCWGNKLLMDLLS